MAGTGFQKEGPQKESSRFHGVLKVVAKVAGGTTTKVGDRVTIAIDPTCDAVRHRLEVKKRFRTEISVAANQFDGSQASEAAVESVESVQTVANGKTVASVQTVASVRTVANGRTVAKERAVASVRIVEIVDRGVNGVVGLSGESVPSVVLHAMGDRLQELKKPIGSLNRLDRACGIVQSRTKRSTMMRFPAS